MCVMCVIMCQDCFYFGMRIARFIVLLVIDSCPVCSLRLTYACGRNEQKIVLVVYRTLSILV